ncbi:MAG: right-handed parallel beta-helix repeat-containing protein, partial [Armatimonadetes bacterium]|nr:right-handed parallel beta-helix repeat-containing protein [Armatimonadota bacterium]
MRLPLTRLTTFWPRRLLKGRSLRFAGLLVILMASLLVGWKALFATPDTSIGGVISTNTTLGPTGTPGFQDTVFVVTSTLTVNPGVVLTIQPGVTLKFDSSAGLDVNGTLLALGVGSRIKFTRNGTSGNWQGIALTGLGADGSTLGKCDIEYAGNSSYGILFSDCSATMSDCTVTNSVTDGVRITGTSANPTLTSVTISNNGNHGVFVYTNGRGTLDGCTIQDNQYSGVYAYYNQGEAPTIQSGVISGNNILNAGGHGGVVVGALATVSNNTIENNNQSGVRVENGNDLPAIQNNIIRNNTGYAISFAADPFTDAGTKITGNTFTGNTPNNRLEVFGGTLGVNATWTGTINGLGLDVTGTYMVGTGVTLTFDPGQTVFFGPSGGLQANSGTINAQGTVGSRIKFTRNGTSGNWQGIFLSGTSTNASVFSRCDIEYGGSSGYGGIEFSDSSATMTDCTVTSSVYDGVRLDGANANPTLTNVTSSNNGQFGVVIYSNGQGTFSGCTIQNNQYSGVYAYSSQGEAPTIQTCTIGGNNILNAGGHGGVVVGALAAVSNNTIENNNQSGVRVENGNDLPTIQNNLIRNNTGYAISFAANP